jgi:hypothetical protein
MNSGFTVASNEHLLRDNLYSARLKELLLDDLFAMDFVRILTEFPDGNTFNIPSLGEAETSDYAEGQAIKYSRLDTGNFTFSFDTYKYSAHSISEKFKRDSFWSSDVMSAFLPREHRALMEAVEVDIFASANSGQTSANTNTINGADHRFVASGTNDVIAVADFAKARYALRKANVPLQRLVAVLDPSTAYALETSTNITNLLSPMPSSETILRSGLVTGFKYMYNFMGFECYVSNYLPSGISETVDGNSITNGVANLFFSAAPGDTLPIIGGFRQTPTVYKEFNKDLQQTEFLTIAEWGFKLYRPENMVVILSDASQV